jgi:hypothetical protein
MAHQIPTHQRVRKALVIPAFLSFPITMNFFSPYVIVNGAMNGILNGSLVTFGLMFLSSLFLGRAWCGWIYPGGGMQEIVEPINNRTVNGSKINWIKWAIWIPWLSLIIGFVVSAGGYKTVDLLYHTQNGISVAGYAGDQSIGNHVAGRLLGEGAARKRRQGLQILDEQKHLVLGGPQGGGDFLVAFAFQGFPELGDQPLVGRLKPLLAHLDHQRLLPAAHRTTLGLQGPSEPQLCKG